MDNNGVPAFSLDLHVSLVVEIGPSLPRHHSYYFFYYNSFINISFLSKLDYSMHAGWGWGGLFTFIELRSGVTMEWANLREAH